MKSSSAVRGQVRRRAGIGAVVDLVRVVVAVEILVEVGIVRARARRRPAAAKSFGSKTITWFEP